MFWNKMYEQYDVECVQKDANTENKINDDDKC